VDECKPLVGGIGCFLAWACLIQHFERLPPYDTAWIAVHKGLPVVTRFAVVWRCRLTL